MSARIPDHMLISDLLKATGYNCPERLQGKTFEESTTGEGNISIEANKEVTISENGTTVINPSESKDAMEKVTVTVNVPTSGGGSGGGSSGGGVSSGLLEALGDSPKWDFAADDPDRSSAGAFKAGFHKCFFANYLGRQIVLPAS